MLTINPFRVCHRCSAVPEGVALVKTRRKVASLEQTPRVEQWRCPRCGNYYWVLIAAPVPCRNSSIPGCEGLSYPEPILSNPPHTSDDIPDGCAFTWRCTRCDSNVEQIELADGDPDD